MYMKQYYIKNKDKYNNDAKRYYWENRDQVLENCRQWARQNTEKKNAATNKRRAKLLQRVPVWADLDAIKEFYANCPIGYEVDHIIPLQGKTVSGLHVVANLQYLPKSTNRSKGNRF